MAMKIRDSFSMQDWEVMHAFLSRNYRPDLALCSRTVFEWQFMVRPGCREANMFCGWDGERLVGILGFIPIQLFWGETEDSLNGAWAINWYVEEDYRQGLGWLLVRKLQDVYPVVLGTEATHYNQQIVARLGWKLYPRLPRYLSVLDLKQAICMLSSGASEEDLRPMLYENGRADPAGLRNLEQETDDYRPDWRLYPAMAYGAIRSMSYFKWRYFNHPIFKYFIVTAGQSHRPAVCVYRIEQAFGDYRALVARVVDFFYPNDPQGESDGLDLIHAVLRRLRADGCAYADFFCSSHAFGQTLLRARWKIELMERQILPVRLCPIERKSFSYNIELGIAKGLSSPALESTYFTKSDADADRAALLPELLRAK